jgi:hypothetical protein
MMKRYTLSRDGQELSHHATDLEAVGQLHRIQGQSADWAMKYSGYSIEETEETMLATCGHEDSLGYLTNNPCGKCARSNHKKAVGGK